MGQRSRRAAPHGKHKISADVLVGVANITPRENDGNCYGQFGQMGWKRLDLAASHDVF
jgi:hypothetical protein